MLSAGLMISAVLFLTGCCSFDLFSGHNKILTLKNSKITPNEDGGAFLDRASDMEVVDIDSALHGMCIVVDGEDKNADFKSRMDQLQGSGIVAKSWKISPAQSLTKGRLAYMVYQVCGIKEKGVMIGLFGPTQRYCLRELQYNGMMAPGNESMLVTGMELVAVLTRADIYKRTGKFPNEVGQVE